MTSCKRRTKRKKKRRRGRMSRSRNKQILHLSLTHTYSPRHTYIDVHTRTHTHTHIHIHTRPDTRRHRPAVTHTCVQTEVTNLLSSSLFPQITSAAIFLQLIVTHKHWREISCPCTCLCTCTHIHTAPRASVQKQRWAGSSFACPSSHTGYLVCWLYDWDTRKNGWKVNTFVLT